MVYSTSLTLRRRCFLSDSGSTGAGYADFVHHIEDPSGFVFQLGEKQESNHVGQNPFDPFGMVVHKT